MIYFVRHGESEANIEKTFAGQRVDSLLTSKGQEQAKVTGKEMIKQGIKIDRIISSPLKRTLETAKIIANEIGFQSSEIITDERIMEYDMGDLSGTSYKDVPMSILAEAKNGEDTDLFLKRAYSCIQELSKSKENTLLVSHGGIGAVLETVRENIDPKFFYKFLIHKNAVIVKID
jgi:broad specificity phosphatase PhoE